MTVAVSHGLGVDLSASVLPRVDTTDDREVGPTRRNYLSPADVRSLPIGVWVESGPYNRQEWLARGVAGAAGRAAHLRVNDRSYLAVYEAQSGAMWRLDDGSSAPTTASSPTAPPTPSTTPRWPCARALRDRYPDAAAPSTPTSPPRSRLTTGGCRCPAGATNAPRGTCSTNGCQR